MLKVQCNNENAINLSGAFYRIDFSQHMPDKVYIIIIAFCFLLPVVVPKFNVPPWLQNLPVLQPGELRLRLAPSLAGEDGVGADWSGDGLWRLNKLCWS